ncbi:MAG: type II secretion system F family protein [Nanoarchaeota archaeon]|nr:type II secretion system F family protein [Nanoarchaeota archaeon]
MAFYKRLSKIVPGLGDKLHQAGILDTPEEYVRKIFFTSLMIAIGLFLVFFVFFLSPIVILVVPFAVPLLFMYLVKYVDIKIENLRKRIDEEIVYAGRFLIIELESGVPLDKAFESIQTNYQVVGAYFGDIINRVYLGTNMEEAINDTLLSSPSPTLRRILWQLLNSMKTGSDVAGAINSVIDQIVKEQQIAVKEYGKKLNPLAMFYMMISVIVPSLGTTMLVVIATFIGIKLNLVVLLALAAFVGFVQMMFLSIIKSSRPPISA